MKGLLLGDTHAYLMCIPYLQKLHPEAEFLIQVGDFGFWNAYDWPAFRDGRCKFRKPTYVIPGNHEDPKEVHRVRGDLGQVVSNFKLMEDGEILRIGGLSVMGVGSARCVDDPPIRYPFDPRSYTEALERWRAAGEPKIDILVTHDCPQSVKLPGNLAISLKYKLDPRVTGEPLLDELWQAVRPRLHVSGHHHRIWEAEVNGLRHLTLPVGQEGYAILDTDTCEYELRRI